MGTLTDPFGHQWSLATRVEDVPPEEMEQRMQEFSKSRSRAGLIASNPVAEKLLLSK